MKNSKIDELFRILTKEEISDEYIDPDSIEEPPKVDEEPSPEEKIFPNNNETFIGGFVQRISRGKGGSHYRL